MDLDDSSSSTGSHSSHDSDMASTASRRWTDFPSFGNSIVHMPSDMVDQLLGRDLAAAPPAHFSRVLYIPRHDRRVTHLPLYDVSGEYARAVQDVPMGSSKFKVRLSLMRRPSGDGPDDAVSHLLNVHGGTYGVLERRSHGSVGTESIVALPCAGSGMFTVDSPGERGVARSMVSASFPIADQRTPGGTIRFPYFEIAPGRPDHSPRERWQWQIHPYEHGSLRYTLVEMDDDLQPTVKAIYHHVGLGINLPPDYSEGVLLLPADSAESDTELAVASLLGLLWQLRDMHAKKTHIPLLKKLIGRL